MSQPIVIEWRSDTVFWVDDTQIELETIKPPLVLVKNETPFDSIATKEDWAQWGESIVNPFINPVARSEMFKAQRIAQAKARAGIA